MAGEKRAAGTANREVKAEQAEVHAIDKTPKDHLTKIHGDPAPTGETFREMTSIKVEAALSPNTLLSRSQR